MENPQKQPAIVELVDRMTGSVIYNMNCIALGNPTFLQSNGLSDASVIDLDTTQFQYGMENDPYWNLDEKSDNYNRDLTRHSFLLIDYACHIHLKLIQDKKVIVVSKNGISPYIICAFYLLRGVQYSKVGLKYIFFTFFFFFFCSHFSLVLLVLFTFTK